MFKKLNNPDIDELLSVAVRKIFTHCPGHVTPECPPLRPGEASQPLVFALLGVHLYFPPSCQVCTEQGGRWHF